MRRAICAGLLLSFAVGTLACFAVANAAETKKAATVKQPAEEVEMFAAIKAGDIEVRLTPKDSTLSTVRIKNNTKRALSVRLPEAFAGVPVLAQANNNNNNNNSNNANQGVGGGFGGGGFGGGGFGGGGGGFGGGGGGGFFNIAPEAVKKVKVATVCLEHGKKEPRSGVPYEIRPIESLSDDARVHTLLSVLASGQTSQRVAQAAAWHFANNMSWEQLATKERKHLNAPSEPYFSRQEIQAALALAKASEAAAEKAKSSESTTASLGQSSQK